MIATDAGRRRETVGGGEALDRRREARFWAQVDKGAPGTCWRWTGAISKDGYGLFFAGGKNIQAHRFALELKLGRPLGNEVARHADVCTGDRLCCNPDHLAPGSVADNNRDTFERGRQAKGEGHGRHRLTEAQVAEIRRRAMPGGYSALAREFGVSSRQIGHIATGKRWAHSIQSPGALALREHAGLCRRCADVGLMGLPPRALCGAGWILYVAAVRARARRAS